jgi:hypothetical protein
LACQHETRRASARETAEIGGEILALVALRIGDALDGFVKFYRLDRPIAVVPVPGLEKLRDLLPIRVLRLDDFDPLDRIAAAERQQRIADPFAPRLETAERPAPL